MDDREPTKDQLIRELKAVRQDIDRLQIEKAAGEAQTELLQTILACGQRPSPTLLTRAIAQQTLRITNRITNARESSLFILNNEGIVCESVLARGVIVRDRRDAIVGQVLDRGLAGWVNRHRRTAVVTDTTTDERWLQLPGQPYTVRSVLCVPILRKHQVLGIITLMHPDPNFFRSDVADLMETLVRQIAIVFDLVRHSTLHDRPPPTPPPKTLRVQSSPNSSLPQTTAPVSTTDLQAKVNGRAQSSAPPTPKVPPPPKPRVLLTSLAKLGLFISVWDGKFLFASPRLARIFGYTTEELASLKTMFYLIHEEDYDRVAEQIYKCVRGQIEYVSCQFRGKRKDGKTMNVEIYGVRTQFYGKPVTIGVLRRLNKPS